MTRDEAVTRLRRTFGTKAKYTVDKRTTSPERRDRARERYEALLAQREELAKQISEAGDEARAYKFRVYKPIGVGMWEEVAKGDTWEEVFAQPSARAAEKGAA